MISKLERHQASLFGPIYDFFEQLAENGHEIHVLLRSRSKNEKEVARIGNMWFHYINLPQKLKLHRVLAIPTFLVKAIQLCLQHNIDIIYSHIYGFHGLAGVTTAKITRKPSIHWHCGFIGYFRKGMSLPTLISDYYPLRFTTRFVDILLTCTNATKHHYLKYWSLDPKKIKIMPNSVSLNRFNRSITGNEIKQKLNLQ